MPRARFTLSDRALYGLLAVSDTELLALLHAIEHIAAEDEPASFPTGDRSLSIRRVGKRAILFWPGRGDRSAYIFDIRDVDS